MHRAGLAPEGRPAGVFLLLGPTGTGKTRTVEALAEVLHGSERAMVKVDCGEFQMEHEVAKLIGAPPGYLGHRETQPLITQQRLNAVTSENSNLSLVLFDEIEKAAPSLNFERSLIFLTSNLGAEAMRRRLAPEFGFEPFSAAAGRARAATLDRIGWRAVRRRFSPEFINRIDAVITYRPLDRAALEAILDQQLAALERHIEQRLEDAAFGLEVTAAAREFFLEHGTSAEYGARELKRTILRRLTQPLAALVEQGRVAPGAVVRVERQGDGLALRVEEKT
jgi:ATP-dependent Clp protease ATP-binding subunit ClpA